MPPNTIMQKELLKNMTICVKLWKKKNDVMEIGEEQDMLWGTILWHSRRVLTKRCNYQRK